MELNLNKALVDLEGKEIKEANMGKTLGNFLAGNKTELDAVKAWELAAVLHAGKTAQIDSSDLDKLEKSIEGSTVLTPLAQAQLLLEIRKVKVKKDSEEGDK